MAKTFVIPAVPGVKDLFTLLAFLAEQEVYEEHLDSLISIRAEIEGLINKYGEVNEIEGLKKQAEHAAALAQAELKTAQEQAKQLTDKAQADVKSILDNAVKHEQESAQLKADLEAKLAAADIEIAAGVESVNKAQAELDAKLESIKLTEAKAKALKDEYDAKVKKLNEAMGK